MDPLLRYFITKSCLQEGHDLVPCAPILLSIGEQIKSLDPTEDFYHIEPCKDNPLACLIYRKRDWLITLEHRDKLRRESEQARQQNQLEKEAKEKDTLERLTATNLAILKLNQAGKTDREINQILELCWNGTTPTLSAKLGISKWCKPPSLKRDEFAGAFD